MTDNRRVCSYHVAMFHGVSDRPHTRQHAMRPPSLTNSNREPLQIRRSGRFVPSAWMSDLHLIISDQVKERLSELQGTSFLQVMFDKLVDVALPAVGDFSWYDRIAQPPGPEPTAELDSLPDVVDYRQSSECFWEVLPANFYELEERPLDVASIDVNFGSYSDVEREQAIVSRTLLEIYPIVWADVLQLREDAFAEIAPHLNLDYFDIARADLDPEPPNVLTEVFVAANLRN